MNWQSNSKGSRWYGKTAAGEVYSIELCVHNQQWKLLHTDGKLMQRVYSSEGFTMEADGYKYFGSVEDAKREAEMHAGEMTDKDYWFWLSH